MKILKDAYDAGKKFRVVVVDSRPKFEGRLPLSIEALLLSSLFYERQCNLTLTLTRLSRNLVTSNIPFVYEQERMLQIITYRITGVE